MKKEDLFECLSEIDEKEVFKAGSYQVKSAPQRGWLKWAALAACAVIAIAVGIFMFSHKGKKNDDGYPDGVTKVMALYPKPLSVYSSYEDYVQSPEYASWRSNMREKIKNSTLINNRIYDYYLSLMGYMLEAEDENTVCSPLNAYIAFSVLAEVSAGNSREQILKALGVEDISELRSNIKTLWESNYADTPSVKSILANSLWLKKGYPVNNDELDILTKEYYTSFFEGDPTSKDMNEALKVWTDKNTGGLLKKHIDNLELDPTMVFTIMSTIYFEADWVKQFLTTDTEKETFHGTQGDTEVDMMHRENQIMHAYVSDNFTEVSLGLAESGSMIFYLPKEGVDVNELLKDPDIINTLIYDYEDEKNVTAKVNLSIPKFSVSKKNDLIETMEKLGMTDVLTNADFSSLIKNPVGIGVDSATQAAMVEIDEKGVKGAAFTEISTAESEPCADGIIDFVLDRPFMFMITGSDGSVLFAGIVRNI